MSKDKYPGIFSCQMEAIVFITLQIFIAACTVLKTGEYSRVFPSPSWGILDQIFDEFEIVLLPLASFNCKQANSGIIQVNRNERVHSW